MRRRRPPRRQNRRRRPPRRQGRRRHPPRRQSVADAHVGDEAVADDRPTPRKLYATDLEWL